MNDTTEGRPDRQDHRPMTSAYGTATDAQGEPATPEAMQAAGWTGIETIDAECGAYQADITQAEWDTIERDGGAYITRGDITMDIEAGR